MNGTEKYANSGWLLPKGQEQNFLGSSNTFTVAFQKAGTYNYICLLHSWMHGPVLVNQLFYSSQYCEGDCVQNGSENGSFDATGTTGDGQNLTCVIVNV
jgi:hypothetical protein